MTLSDLESEGLSLIIYDWRKVRTPKANVAGNARPSRDEDKCNRKQVRKTSVLAVVKPGKLYAVQRHVNQRLRVARPMLEGRRFDLDSNVKTR